MEDWEDNKGVAEWLEQNADSIQQNVAVLERAQQLSVVQSLAATDPDAAMAAMVQLVTALNPAHREQLADLLKDA